ncbi:MAG: CPBP family intramembrane glutamic endopeptidase [Candidatus Babeliales bacterium]
MLYLFIITTYCISWTLLYYAVAPDLVMFVPGLTAFFFMIVERKSFFAIVHSLRLGSFRNLFLGFLISLSAFLLYISCAHLSLSCVFGLSEQALAYHGNSAFKAWISFFTIGFPSLFAVSLFFAFFEEIGWRGYLLKKINQRYSMSILKKSSIVGLLWGLWHIPLYIISPTEPVRIVIFLCNVVLIAIPYTWLYEGEYSVWPTTIAHALHNTLFNVVLSAITLHSSSSLWLYGEEGLLVTGVYSILIIIGFLVNKFIQADKTEFLLYTRVKNFVKN